MLNILLGVVELTFLAATCRQPGYQHYHSHNYANGRHMLGHTKYPRAPAAYCLEEGSPSLRQRLKDVQVEPAITAEANAVVGFKPFAGGRHRADRSAQEQAGLPLHNPFGTKPRFVASASRISSLPTEDLPEVAFIGRSNVGKSSLLNALTGVSSLAKVSSKPGKTQALNFFELGLKENAFRLVDMPGYGFAFAREDAVSAWRELSAEYLRARKSLKLVLVLLDARVGLKSSDLQMLTFLESCKVKYSIVLTKADAAGPPLRAARLTALTLSSIKKARHFQRPAALVSARTGAGVGRLQRRVIESATGKDPMAHVDGGWAKGSMAAVPARGGGGGRGSGSGRGRGKGRGGRGGRGAQGRGRGSSEGRAMRGGAKQRGQRRR
jgi:ribosome biogenesis GTP-binding protein YsxC/EngB